MFNVLVIAYYFPPKGLSGVQRTLKFVKYMPKYNWRPTVLTSEVNAYYAYDQSLMDDVNPSEVRVVRVAGKDINSRIPAKGIIKMPSELLRKILSYVSSIFFVPDNKKGWAQSALPVARELIKKEHFDLIFVSGPPFSTVMMAAELKKEFGIPLVVDYRDLWFGANFAIYPTPFHISLTKRQEADTLRVVDKIIVINRQIKEKIMEYYKFLEHREIVIIPQGFDADDFEKAGTEPKMNNKLLLSFSGFFYAAITPKYLLAAFKALLVSNPDVASNIQLQFIGIPRKNVIRQIKKLNIEPYVKMTGYVSHLESVRKINSSDALWVTITKTRNYDTISSSKSFEYIGAQKPIMALIYKGALYNTLQEYQAAYICEPDNIDQIKELLVRLYTDYKNNRLPKPSPEVVAKYRRDNLTEILTKEFQFLVSVR